MTDKRCGTCQHWTLVAWRNSRFGECNAPLPDSLVSTDQDATLPTAGVDCPCWKRKEQL